MSRAIFFDVDGVVINGYHSRPELRRMWDTYLEEDLGIGRDVFQNFIRTTFIAEVQVGKKSLINALEEALPELGYKGSALDIAAYWINRDSYLNHPLLNHIKHLRGKGHKVYLATNQEHLRAFYLWNSLGLNLLFDDVFYSARMGVSKPEAAYFEKIAQKVDLTQATPLLFDDSPNVIEGATKAGWDATLFNSLDDFTNHPFIQAELGL